MADFSVQDIKKVTPVEENVVKKVITDAWVTMKRTNWDDTKYCTFNPSVMLNYSMAKNFQSFYENEGWSVIVKKDSRNYLFDIYRPFDNF